VNHWFAPNWLREGGVSEALSNQFNTVFQRRLARMTGNTKSR